MLSRIVDSQELARIVTELRAQKKRIVATNGCFDILHSGHVHYLEAAKQLGDVMIVGINSDESVHKLKGPARPINNQDDRAEVLSALRSVDYVSIFCQETAAEFLKIVKPDVYAKGGDYTVEELPETPVVESHGGKVVILDLVPDKSTTAIIARMHNQAG